MHCPPLRALVGAAGAAALLTACGTVTVPAGPTAADPACAEITIGAPTAMLGQERTETTSQSTVAWGHGEETVVMRCGVVPPGPTTDQCTRLDDGAGHVVDWIVRENNGVVLYTTYGREPAVDVSVPRALAPDQPSAGPLELNAIVSQLPVSTTCV